MPNPKVARVDPKSGFSSAEFLAGGPTPMPVMQSLEPSPVDSPVETPAPVAEPPGKKQEINAVVPPTAPAPVPAAPVKPHVPSVPDPFVSLWNDRDEIKGITRAISAMPIDDFGCVVKIAWQTPHHIGSTCCFVPGSKIENGKLVKA